MVNVFIHTLCVKCAGQASAATPVTKPAAAAASVSLSRDQFPKKRQGEELPDRKAAWKKVCTACLEKRVRTRFGPVLVLAYACGGSGKRGWQGLRGTQEGA